MLRRQWAPMAFIANSFPLHLLSSPTLLRAMRPYTPTLRHHRVTFLCQEFGDLLLHCDHTMAPLLPLLQQTANATSLLAVAPAPADQHALFRSLATDPLLEPASSPTAVAPPAPVYITVAIFAQSYPLPLRSNALHIIFGSSAPSSHSVIPPPVSIDNVGAHHASLPQPISFPPQQTVLCAPNVMGRV